MRRLLAALLLLLLPGIALAAFKDVQPGNSYATAVTALQSQAVIGGYPDGTFRPTQPINRAELMKILVVGALNINPNPPSSSCFPDVHDEWFAPYVCFAYGSKWVQGYPDGGFHPNNTLTQAEALKMIVVSLAPPDGSNVAGCDTSQWYGIYLCQANRLHLMQSGFKAAAPMTRGMAAQWIYLALKTKGHSSAGEAQSSISASAMSTPSISVSSSLSSSMQFSSVSSSKYDATVTPTSQLSCAGAPRACLAMNLSFWTEERKKLTAKVENMTHQPNGNGCMQALALIDQDWVTAYNNYVAAYNNYFGDNIVGYAQSLTNVEGEMRNIVDRIESAPTYCY